MGHNVQETTLWDQKGGTALMTIGWMSAFVVNTGVNHTMLGCWSWALVCAGEGGGAKLARMVVAYQPCEPGPNSKGSTVFEQQLRYFEARGDFRSPRSIFTEHLVAQLLK